MEVHVNSKGHSNRTSRSPEQWYLFIQIKSGEERIQVTCDFWKQIQPNTNIELNLIPGYFGYPYITSYKLM